jgi:hypothetical protein
MNPRLILLSGLFGLLFTSCASIVNQSSQDVQLDSTPFGAEVVVTNKATGETVFTGETPAKVELEKGDGYFSAKDYQVEFHLDGYQPRTVDLEHSLSAWYWGGNLVLGGLIGYLIVDPITGAMWNLPETLNEQLVPIGDLPREREPFASAH